MHTNDGASPPDGGPSMSPMDAAFHDFADANQGAEGYDCFVGGWEAATRLATAGVQLDDEERERTRVFWQTKVASVEAERDALIQRLATACYERDSFRRARDMLAGLLERARVESLPRGPSIPAEAQQS